MADLIASNSPTIKNLMANLNRYKTNPTGIQRVVYDYLSEVTGGQVDIVDPTNPFVFLLESSAVNTAVAINENLVNLRKQYASMAQTMDDLYCHMTDRDFMNRFATPSSCDITVMVQVNDIINKLVWSQEENCFKGTIARDTQFVVDDYIFTLEYPINVRKFTSGQVQVDYDTTILSPITTLDTNIIQYRVRKDPSGVEWLFFQAKVKQFKIDSATFPLQQSIPFSQNIVYDDQFYLARVYQKNNYTGGRWREIKTTHSEQVYDPRDPTAVLRAYDNVLNVSIPVVYLSTGTISGDIRIDIYTTKGEMNVNFSNYQPESFSMRLTAIDELRDLNIYTETFSKLQYYSFTKQIVSGGTNGKTFEELRQEVIYNSTGPQQLPVTNKNVESYAKNNGFHIVKDVDVVTNRIFLASKKLPKPINSRLLTSANLGISTIVANMEMLKREQYVEDTGNRITIRSMNLFRQQNGITTLMAKRDVDVLKVLPNATLVTQVNNNNYLFNPFYYVLDNSDNEFTVRVYNLDYPEAKDLSFISQNQSLQLPVNTAKYRMEKVHNGYKLTVITISDGFYKGLQDNQVDAQLGFYPDGESRMAYINGVKEERTADEERVFTFLIETKHDINASDMLAVSNARMFGNEAIDTWMPLEGKIHIFYTTTDITDNYTRIDADSQLGTFILPANSAVCTLETLDIKLGSSLKNLWSRSRSLPVGDVYRKYEYDIPLRYEDDVYEIDPDTGSMLKVLPNGDVTYNKLHSRGDQVLDESGEVRYKYRRGDVMLDDQGHPVIDIGASVDKEFDMLFVDGRYYFTNDGVYTSYIKEVVDTIDTWVTRDVADIQKDLLEETKIYFYPDSSIGKLTVDIHDYGTDTIDAEQSLEVDLYVSPAVYNDSAMRQRLEDLTIRYLDQEISSVVVNMFTIQKGLMEQFGGTVEALDVRGLGGSSDYRLLSTSATRRLCLKKILVTQQDGTRILKEDVIVNFYRR
jgi:hypothetical protein